MAWFSRFEPRSRCGTAVVEDAEEDRLVVEGRASAAQSGLGATLGASPLVAISFSGNKATVLGGSAVSGTTSKRGSPTSRSPRPNAW